MNTKHTPSIERLNELFTFDPVTGVLRRKIARGSSPAGAVAGGDNSHGYLCVPIDGRRYMVHNVGWAIHFGQWPAAILDHRDRNRAHNAIGNLRLSSNESNQGNTKLNVRNTSGHRGVSKRPRGDGWLAYIKVNGKNRRLGQFATPELAAAAYSTAARAKFGEFYP
jgi:hypothetical protein